MATGQEMAMQMAMKLFGIDTEQSREQILQAARAVLSFDTRLQIVEQQQAEILSILRTENHDGKFIENDRGKRNGDGAG